MNMELNKIYQGNCLDVLKTFPDNSINCVITSPPYWGLRDYGTATWEGGDSKCDHINGALQSMKTTLHPGTNQNDKRNFTGMPYKNICGKCGAKRIDNQLGLETTFQEYITKLCDIFDEVKRVLKDDGTCWVNIGDTYASNGGASRHYGYQDPKYKDGRAGDFIDPGTYPQSGALPKSLCQIPSRFAIEMTNRGWILRNEIIWHKPNCLSGGTILYARTQRGVMPSTLKDLVRLKPETVSLWDGEKWNSVISWIKNNNPVNIREITLVNGDKYNCTGEHIFMVGGIKTQAKDLKIGDILDNSLLPDNSHGVELIPDKIGWLIGLYIAEGSRGNKKKCLQFSSHVKEDERFNRLVEISKEYDDVCSEHQTSEYGKTINIYSKILSAIIDTYVAGDSCYNKHLTSKAWRRNNRFLNFLLEGYLSGDGHWDKENNRWRVNFTKENKYLNNDIKTICARLGYDCRIKKLKNSYMGNIKITKSHHANNKNPYQIVANNKGKRFMNYYDVTLKDSPNLFVTNSGVLIHNCMPSSATDRFTVDFEKVFFFVKNKKYWFEQQLDDAIWAAKDKRSQIKGGVMSKGKCATNQYATNKVAYSEGGKKNRRTVWSINTKGFKDAHFATYPTELIEPMVKSGCPEYVCSKCGEARKKYFGKKEYLGNEKPITGKYRDGDVNSAGGREHYLSEQRKYPVDQYSFANFLKEYTKGKSVELNDAFTETRWKHWIRTDDSGASLPSKEQYLKLKEILNLPNDFDKEMLTTVNILVDDKGGKNEFLGYTTCSCNSTYSRGIVLDPFFGSGTTGYVASSLNRDYIGIELNPKYIKIAEKRLFSFQHFSYDTETYNTDWE